MKKGKLVIGVILIIIGMAACSINGQKELIEGVTAEESAAYQAITPQLNAILDKRTSSCTDEAVNLLKSQFGNNYIKFYKCSDIILPPSEVSSRRVDTVLDGFTIQDSSTEEPGTPFRSLTTIKEHHFAIIRSYLTYVFSVEYFENGVWKKLNCDKIYYGISENGLDMGPFKLVENIDELSVMGKPIDELRKKFDSSNYTYLRTSSSGFSFFKSFGIFIMFHDVRNTSGLLMGVNVIGFDYERKGSGPQEYSMVGKSYNPDLTHVLNKYQPLVDTGNSFNAFFDRNAWTNYIFCNADESSRCFTVSPANANGSYIVSSNNGQTWTTQANGAGMINDVEGVYTVFAANTDSQGNYITNGTSHAMIIDKTGPSVSGTPVVSNITSTGFTVTWNPAQDVVKYGLSYWPTEIRYTVSVWKVSPYGSKTEVVCNGNNFTPTITFVDEFTPATKYEVQVTALDHAENSSNYSTVYNIYTLQ